MHKLRKFAEKLKINCYNKGFLKNKKFKLTCRLSAKIKMYESLVHFYFLADNSSRDLNGRKKGQMRFVPRPGVIVAP